jgi:hypothetical protein
MPVRNGSAGLRLLNRLFVTLFVRRKAQAHARAVLDDKAKTRKKAPAGNKPAKKPAAKVAAKSAPGASDGPAGPEQPAAAPQPGETQADVPAAAKPPVPAGPVIAGRPVEPGSPRETLIATALAARKAREAEWDASSPAEKSRAIAGLGESMAALVETFRAPANAPGASAGKQTDKAVARASGNAVDKPAGAAPDRAA